MSVAAELTVDEAEEKDFLSGYNDPDFKPTGEQTDAEKAAAEKADAEKVAAAGEQTDAEKVAAEKADAEKAEAERVAAAGEQTDAEKSEAEKAEAEKVAAEKAEAEKVAAGKAYQPDYSKLLKDTADEIKRDNREAISRLTAKPETKKSDDLDLTKTATDVTKALEGLSDDEIKKTMQKVRDTDPETADAIEGLFGKVTGTVGSLAKAVDSLRVTHEADQAKAAKNDEASAVAQVETTIAAKHPNFRDIVGSADGKVPPTAEFTKWFNEMPAYLQETARKTDDPNVFVSILDKFVADTKPDQTDAEKAAAEKADAEKVAAAGEQTDAEKAIEDARRAGARQPGTKPHAERQATNKNTLNEDDEWMKGYNDPDFEKKK